MAYVINPVSPTISYTATAGQTVFAVPFAFFAGTDLVVKDNGVVQSDATYTVAGALTTSGGSVTFLSGRTLGHIITIERNVPIQRVTDFPTSGPFNVDLLNEDLDRIVAILQELALAPDAAASLLADAAAYATAAGSSATAASGSASSASGAAGAASSAQSAAAQSAADAAAAALASTGIRSECRLSYVSTTAIRLDRCNGSFLFVNGVNRQIPAVGPSLSNSGFGVSGKRYIYAFMSGATLTLEASATVPVIDGTYGHKIKTGDATRTLVGWACTNASSQFQFDGTVKTVASYYNRSRQLVTNGSSLTSATSTLTAIASVFIFNWDNEAVSYGFFGRATINSAPSSVETVVTLDGVSLGNPSSGTVPSNGYFVPVNSSRTASVAEDAHSWAVAARNVSGLSSTYEVGVYAETSI